MGLWKKMLNVAVCLLFFVQADGQKSRRDLSSLINLLSQKQSGNRQPLLVILETGSKRNAEKDQKYRAGSPETSDEYGIGHIPHLLLQHKVKNLLKKSTTKSYVQLKNEAKQLHRLQKLRDNQELRLNDKNVLRSPIVKQLLRISNRIQCEAKDECQDKCGNRYKGKKVVTCNMQCEVKYECEEEEYRDPCEQGGCDSCGNSLECLMSTRGERLVTEETKCKRC
ncbi:uncharacterized protein LOC126778571 isoform X2 [Nymphalis io]|uniref:uncharacterized protein LOC126778571 isoform X2 n=1 Tax=Inachis io TaxID=171585 RepID=UPI0021683227|nr:uncharacterized protein LOC126778571 isoform X2 [Nymphalis io]